MSVKVRVNSYIFHLAVGSLKDQTGFMLGMRIKVRVVNYLFHLAVGHLENQTGFILRVTNEG